MKNNIVKIRTYTSSGTGILYPCKYSAIERVYSAYLVFTCAHIFEEQLSSLPNDGADIKRWVDLGIYDDLGNLVEESDIKEIRYHIPQNFEDSMCDIAVLLVQIKKSIRITLETKIYQNELKNREILYVEGFPRVMLNDDINQKIQLEGMYKELFSKNSVVGMYQIKDDYHWYNDYQDLKLMEGFSGSPVYIEKNDEVYLLGMNQSVANIDKGENPFKMVYYLKMKYIVDCLRQSDCIVFRANRDGSLDIEWMIDQVQNGKEINMLILGGSGAGKSTFTKSFAYHSKKLNTTGDGQTTRANVFYRFSISPKQSRVRVKFFSKSDFIDSMLKQLMVRKWVCFLEDIVGIDGMKMDNMGYAFIKNIYPFFRYLKKRSVTTKNEQYNELRKEIRNQADNIEDKISVVLLESPDTMQKSFDKYMEQISDCYNVVFAFLGKYIPIKYWRYFDINVWEEELKKGKHMREQDDRILQIVYEASDEGISWKTYLEKLGENLFIKYFDLNKSCNSIDIFNDKKYVQLCYSMLHLEGYFDIKEVAFLNAQETESWKKLMDADSSERRKLVYSIEKENDEERENNKERMSKINRDISKTCKYLYGCIYDSFKKYIIEDEIELDLTEGDNDKTQEIVEKCFQPTSKGSLTIFTRSIVVEDKISNQYAWILKRLNIKQLNILDSCGLDHVKNNKDDSIKIKNVITEYREAIQGNDEAELEDQFAVLFLKKLDSGKPDELRNIIPTVVNAVPKAPIYCVFTGIDYLYEKRDFCIKDLNWNEANLKKVPKVVKYLLLDEESYERKEREKKIDEKAENLFSGTSISSLRKHNLYLVLKNNLIPFCGNEKLVHENYDFYEANQKYVEKLLTSILIDEVGSMEIVSIDGLKLDEKKSYISDIVRLIFEKATKVDWDKIHHMIKRADYNRLSKEDEPEYGYYSFVANVRLKWYQLFLDAYDEVISKEPIVRDFIRQFPDKEQAAIEGILLQMGERYLFGKPEVFNQKEESNQQTEFRMELNTLYEEGELVESDKEKKHDYAEIKKYLEEKTNFIERYDKLGKSERFVEIFIDAFKKQANDNNSVKAEGLIKINEEFCNAIHNLEILFETKYGNDELLYTALKEYAKRKINNKKCIDEKNSIGV